MTQRTVQNFNRFWFWTTLRSVSGLAVVSIVKISDEITLKFQGKIAETVLLESRYNSNSFLVSDDVVTRFPVFVDEISSSFQSIFRNEGL